MQMFFRVLLSTFDKKTKQRYIKTTQKGNIDDQQNNPLETEFSCFAVQST